MTGEINQQNLYLLLPSKVSLLAGMIQENENMQLIDAIKKVYSSDIYKKLEQEETKVWHLGPVDLYNEIVRAE